MSGFIFVYFQGKTYIAGNSRARVLRGNTSFDKCRTLLLRKCILVIVNHTVFTYQQSTCKNGFAFVAFQTHSGSRGHHQDLLLLAGLESLLSLLGCFFRDPHSLLPSSKKGGGSGGPQGDSCQTEFYLWESHWSQNGQTALPSLSNSGIMQNVI